MLEVKSNEGTVDILQMEGTEKRIVADIGAAAHKTLLVIANQGAKTEQEVYLRYGVLARELVDYIDTTVNRIDELGK